MLPRRHVTALDQLTAEEAADLGPLLRALTAALREVLGCSKTYVALFAEAEGFVHAHFHVMPGQPHLDPRLRGPRAFSLLGGDPASHVPARVMHEVAISVGPALRLES
jgi:diadenosine tetraphosphate (Ap4A) HIT family hydrolase